MDITSQEVSAPVIQVKATESIARTWVEINRAALEHNLMLYKKKVMPALFAPVIKSNAYGHGIVPVARICEESPAVDRLCVVALSEAILLRSLGIKKPILVLSILDAPYEQIVHANIIVTIYDAETAVALNKQGELQNKKITVHIKIDTGLSRLGVLADQAVSFVCMVYSLPYIYVEGIFTHFANSECEDQSFAQEQLASFQSVSKQLELLHIQIPIRHVSCSAALTVNDDAHQTMARAGIGVYGLWPSQENKKMTQYIDPLFQLQPVLTWKTTIIQLKNISAGSFVGYDLTHQVTTDSRIAVLPVGYWDGYSRALSNKGTVYIKGQQAPVVGRIAMNLMMIDVTNISEIAVGDEVILLGAMPGVTAEDVAARAQTINYEIVTRINSQLLRVVV